MEKEMKEMKDFTELFKDGKINVRIETEKDIEKINEFCKREDISLINNIPAKVGNYVFCEDNKLWTTDERFLNELENYGDKELKVDFNKVEKYFTSPISSKEIEMIELLNNKVNKMNEPNKAINLLDHYANGFKEVFSKECVDAIEKIKDDYTKDKGIEVVNKMFNKEVER